MENVKKIMKFVKTVLNVIISAFFILFLLVVCLQRFSDNKMSFFNYRMFTVISGSMEPKYTIGDVLISKETNPSKIKVGDTISYLGEKGDFNGKVITHQVINIEQDVDGNYIFHTKGLANLVEDPVVYERQLYGVVVHKSVVLSFIYKIIGKPFGLFLFIVIPLFYIIGSEMISFLLSKEEKRRNKE